MTNDVKYDLRGLLLERRRGFIERSEISKSPRMKYLRQIPDSEWEEFVFSSEIPLRGEDEENNRGLFNYPVFCRRSAARILLMSLSRKIVEHMLDNNLADIFFPKPRYVSIAVDHLVKALVKQPTIYAISFIHARLPAFGASLRAASFYGDDLGEASIFRENVNLMNCFSCGLRSAAGRREIVRLGTDGSISFKMYSDKTVTEVESILRFLRRKGYLPTQIWESESY